MYDFYYNHLKVKYGDKICLCYTDTDSLLVSVQTDCFYTDMKQNIDRYDTSDYAENNPYGIPRRGKKVPGLFKDENNGKIMTHFVGLRSKVYSVRVQGVHRSMKRTKGVKKYVLQKNYASRTIWHA